MVIPEEDPLSRVQERYAKGDVSTEEYKSFLHLYQKTNLCHQIPSLKIIFERYAVGDISFAQLKEIFSNIFGDIICYGKSEPLRILQMRYVNGEINSEKFEKMIKTIQNEVNANKMTPALCTLLIRYSKGEIDHNQYEKMQSNLSEIFSQDNRTKDGEDKVKPSSPSKINSFPSPTPSSFDQSVNRLQHPPLSSDPSLKPNIHVNVRHDKIHPSRRGDIEEIESSNILNSRKIDMTQGSAYHIAGVSQSSDPLTVIIKKDEPDKSNVHPHQSFFQQIREMIKQGNYQETIKRLNEMLDGNPDNSRALFFKGIALFNIGDIDEALLTLSLAKKYASHPDEENEIERIYSHILKKAEEKKLPEKEASGTPDSGVINSVSDNAGMEVSNEDRYPRVCAEVQRLIDIGDYKSADETLADIDNIVKVIPYEQFVEKGIDDLYAAKGFILYQIKKYCEARKFFKESIRINPNNESAIHYLNDARVRDCNKYIRHI